MGGSEVLVFDDCLDENGVTTLLEHPLGIVASNGSGFSLRDQARLVHPRCFGTAAKYLRLAIAGNHISLPEAIRKLTSAPAAKLGLRKRGILAVDNFADLVLFDPAANTPAPNLILSPSGQVGGTFLTRSS